MSRQQASSDQEAEDDDAEGAADAAGASFLETLPSEGADWLSSIGAAAKAGAPAPVVSRF